MTPTYPIRRFIEAQSRSDSKEMLLSELVADLCEFAGSDSCDIFYRDSGDGLVMKASTVSPDFTNRLILGKGVGIVGSVLQTGVDELIEADVQKDPRYARYPGLDNEMAQAIYALPLIEQNDRVFGVVVLRRNVPWHATKEERARLREIVDVCALVLRGYSAAHTAGANINRLGALSEVSKTISRSPYVEEILQLLVNLTAQQFNYTVCTGRLLDESRGELVLRATQAPAKAYAKKRAIALGESIAGRAIAENRPIIVRDVQVEADYIGHDLAVEQGLRSMICIPLMLQEKPVGVLSCYTSDVRDFLPDEIKALETLAKQAAVSIEHAKLQVRNTLMQEMHHRVKNNLQQVASLLRLQLRHGEYKSLDEALNDCLSRILAIASVHDLLSREDLDHVGIRSIAESLVHHQKSSLILPNKHISFDVRGSDIYLNMSQATQLALVLNELIQNAIEHGFAISSEGEIHVNVEHLVTDNGVDEIGIWVSNSGDRLPPDFDPNVQSHLGLKIVDSLARALGGRYKIGDVLGWTVSEVRFPRASGE